MGKDELARALETLRAALLPFSNFADPRGYAESEMPITLGSAMAKRQLTMGDCYAACSALAALRDAPAERPASVVADQHAASNTQGQDGGAQSPPPEEPNRCLVISWEWTQGPHTGGRFWGCHSVSGDGRINDWPALGLKALGAVVVDVVDGHGLQLLAGLPPA